MKLLKHVVLLAAVWCGANSAVAQTWTQTSAPTNHWLSVASSADGSKLIAVDTSGHYYISTNSGITWNTNNEPQLGSLYASWSYIANSADGTEYVGASANVIWISTNSGLTWLSNNVPGATFLGPATVSADGSKIAAATGDNASTPSGIYVSTNSGVTWAHTSAPSNHWQSVACSADGNKIVAVASDAQLSGSIYISTNAGFTWVQRASPNLNMFSAASSADGNKLVVASNPIFNFGVTPYVLVSPGLVYTSTNSGITWVSNNLPNTFAWQGVASSADGNRLVAVSQGGNAIFTSTNSGATWISNNVSSQIWIDVASSADGDRFVAVSVNSGNGSSPGGVYNLYSMPSPQLNVTPSPTNLTLAWTVPSTNFVLQQSTDLVSWSVVTNPPVLNLTNLQNQVTLATSNASGFYRLKMP